MAYEINIGYDITVSAAADLSAKQFCFVLPAGTVAGAGGKALGVLQNNPANGKAAAVRVMGVSKVQYGGNVAVGDYLSSDANGKAVKATVASVNTSDAGVAADPVVGTHVLAIALEAGVSGDVGTVALIHAGLTN